MPELPEVETVRRGLDSSVKNKVFKDIIVYHKNIISDDQNTFIKTLKNRTIKEIDRKGKFLIFHLDSNDILIAHLGMEGKLIPGKSLKDKSPYVRVLFIFKDNSILNFDDSRCFGLLTLRNIDNYLITPPLSHLGIEAIDNNIDVNKIYPLIHASKRTIKETLLDQSIVSGLGNIYVDETLFKSKISPLSKANLLSKNDVSEILKNAKAIMLDAIKHNGTTVFSFSWGKNHAGEYQKYLKAYGHKGESCEYCSTPLVKIKVGGRGTTYCPKCAKLKTDKYVLGIAGGVSVGKSTALKILKDLSYITISADDIVNELYKNEFVKKKLENIFSTSKKDEIRKIVKDNPTKLKKLESILHPLVKQHIQNFIKNNDGFLAIEVPLLFQTGFDALMDETLLILSNKNESLIKNRGDKSIAQININSSKNFSFYKREATYVINNNTTLKDFIKEVKNISKI